MLEYKTQIVKLKNGIDLVANVSTSGLENYILEEPMEFAIDYRGSGAGLSMRHWLPVQLVKKNSVEVKSDDIMCFIEPDDQFAEYYVNTIEKIKQLLSVKNSVYDMTDEEINEVMNNIEDIKNDGYLLH
jgi:hypothetical protein